MAKTYRFKCPHCGKVQTKTEFEIVGHDAMMDLMPGPRLLFPEGTYPCEECRKAISIAEIMAGKHDVPGVLQVACGILVLLAIVVAACYFLFGDTAI